MCTFVPPALRNTEANISFVEKIDNNGQEDLPQRERDKSVKMTKPWHLEAK